MKVYLGASTLAAGDREAASGYTVEHVRGSQVVEYVRGAYAGVFGRGNFHHVVRFSVTRIHADLATAEAFVHDHPSSLPQSGTFHVESNTGTGDRWMAGAVLADVRLDSITGKSTRFTYTIVGGEMLTADPG